MSRQLIASTITAAVLALCAGAATAQTTGAATAGGTSGGGASPAAKAPGGAANADAKKDKLARGDRKFVQEAAGSGMFEVQAAELATTKATDPAVKQYAAMLVDHHKAANAELTRMATAAGVELSPAPPRALRSDLDKMGKKSGADFDKEYVQQVGIKAHDKDIKSFEKASKELKDPQLKSWAANTLPTLKQHLAAAQKLPQAGGKGKSDAASMGAAGAAGTGSTGAAGASGPSTGSSTGGGAATGTGGASGANKTGS